MAGAEDDEYTYDADTPFVPDLADLGGEDFADDTENPPTKGIEPYAGLFSEHSRNLAGVNRIICFCRIWLEWTGAAWTITGLDAMGSEAKVDDTMFTVTPDATGVVTISWTAGTLPAMARRPLVMLTGAYGSVYGTVVTTNSIVVRIHDDTDTAANLDFCVDIK